jgi:hypothetical protein
MKTDETVDEDQKFFAWVDSEECDETGVCYKKFVFRIGSNETATNIV